MICKQISVYVYCQICFLYMSIHVWCLLFSIEPKELLILPFCFACASHFRFSQRLVNSLTILHVFGFTPLQSTIPMMMIIIMHRLIVVQVVIMSMIMVIMMLRKRCNNIWVQLSDNVGFWLTYHGHSDISSAEHIQISYTYIDSTIVSRLNMTVCIYDCKFNRLKPKDAHVPRLYCFLKLPKT